MIVQRLWLHTFTHVNVDSIIIVDSYLHTLYTKIVVTYFCWFDSNIKMVFYVASYLYINCIKIVIAYFYDNSHL